MYSSRGFIDRYVYRAYVGVSDDLALRVNRVMSFRFQSLFFPFYEKNFNILTNNPASLCKDTQERSKLSDFNML
jgi:hypothetical protein